ncbi:Bacterial regulatory protein, Fis family [Rubripirellula amarantea]|uniref:Bacterial regulatory protein, Fis family n=2 Tax=Rubripirellula amarantea TaxID=2527999 RepID=A0A5C5WKK0_9BACT|nr:Bacterial regulatory protein, Fis family [Rubripirellula amarantea]
MTSEYHVLVISNDPHARLRLANGLGRMADRLVTVESVDEGIQMLVDGRFQLVVINVDANIDQDCWDAISLVKQHKLETDSVTTLAEITAAAERAGIVNALAANDHHRESTAKALGISVRTLHYKMNRYDLHQRA